MNVIITGASGFVGKNLSKTLADKHKLFLASRHAENDDSYYLDLNDKESVKKFIDLLGSEEIDVLIHTAGKLVSSGMTFDEQMEIFNENIAITRNVVEIVNKLKIKRLINFSSMAVYPNENGVYSERSEIRMSCNSDCLYGVSKFCAENIFDFALNRRSQVVHLRLSQIFGNGMRDDRIIPVMYKSIVDLNEVSVYGDGERTSNFIHVSEVCKIVQKIIDDPDISGIYNVGDKNISYLQLAEQLVSIYGNDSTKIIKIPEGPRMQFILDTEKINNFWRD